MNNNHHDQLTVSAATVEALVREQFPQWQELSVRAVDPAGTGNAIFRIGERLVARFPLRPDDARRARRALEAEAAAARQLLGRTRFPTPEPVALGRPGAGFPLPWSIQTWLPGTVATEEAAGGSVELARDLSEFILGLRAIDTTGRAFRRSGRGGDLTTHDEWMETCFRRNEDLLDVPHLRRMWAVLRTLPRTAPDVLTHGDLIPGNILVRAGRLAGVLDVGGLKPADPAVDLVCAWHLLEGGPRRALRLALGCDDLGWDRGRAWAFIQAMSAASHYATSNRTTATTARRALDRLSR